MEHTEAVMCRINIDKALFQRHTRKNPDPDVLRAI